ncbi:Zn(II)2Cys6 transcription factor [Sporobolomyces salmoneus]|uniref:Zn(II)2Cys6 transcription factor n=1 Tax=Sporobolomyces salmoneus TaxID=183962 RepID=UPI003172E75C
MFPVGQAAPQAGASSQPAYRFPASGSSPAEAGRNGALPVTSSLPVPTTSNGQGHPPAQEIDTNTKPRVSGGERSGIKRSAKACNHCRKGKARCDGFDSYPCRRCREGGVECIFEGIPVEELIQRTKRKREEVGSPAQESPSYPSALESRLRAIEGELDRLKSQNRKLEARLDSAVTSPPVQASSNATSSSSPGEMETSETMAREAFDLFWQHYAPLAPYISPTEDRYEDVRVRSPLLTHSIVAVASRFQENREFVESNRAEATRLLRETLFTETPLTLDDLKGIVLYSAWLGRGAPPGHSISLALQLDLPKALERLLSSITKPPQEAALAFDQLMPAVRIWLTLYAQDLWLSFAMGRRSMVTIDLSITNARLLLNFSALRPVDARLIAQSELVTILGIVQETFLKMQHQTTETVHVVMQANSHLDNWIKTWSEWAKGQEEASGRYVLASLTMLLQGGRFYSNTLGLRDITKPEELLPMHMPCLRTALDAAVRIQGIHPAQKIAHAAEFTLITLSTSALFLLKMIKLTPHAFSPYSAPFYPAFPPTSPATLDALDPSSPDVSASPEMVNAPSITQALEAVRHSAGLLASVPPKQRSYHQAVVAALLKLEGELAANSLQTSLGGPSPAGDGGANRGEKRPREEDEGDDAAGSQSRRLQPPPQPSSTTGGTPFDFSTLPTYSGGLSATATPKANGVNGEGEGNGNLDDLTDLSIASLVGTQAFWSWESTLPGDINAGLSSIFA